MSSTISTWATGAASVGAAVSGGVLYAFSTFIMRALARLTPAEGIRAMQAINITVITPAFLGVFLGIGLVCIGLAIASVASWGAPGSAWRLVGALLYVVGTLGVTMACNVPRNDALAKLDADSPAAEVAWRTYVDEWTRWNHVRTAAAVAAAAALLAAATSRP